MNPHKNSRFQLLLLGYTLLHFLASNALALPKGKPVKTCSQTAAHLMGHLDGRFRDLALSLGESPGPRRLGRVLTASVSDPSGSTGATLISFPYGARVAADVRGGSVASSELSLFSPGSYSNEINGIVLSGGSTMGLEAGSGVRAAIFEALSGDSRGAFDAIPSIPTAVVYDYGARKHPGANATVYPDRELGRQLWQQRQPSFRMGRAGAGTCTTCNKIGLARFSGQGAAQGEVEGAKVLVIVVLNPVGDVISNGQSLTRNIPAIPDADTLVMKPGQNTTLTVVITDLQLDRNALDRMAIRAHTSLARSINPFHTYHDGDVLLAVSLNPTNFAPGIPQTDDREWAVGNRIEELLEEATREALRASNPIQ